MSSQLRSHIVKPSSVHIAAVCANVYGRGGLPPTQPPSSPPVPAMFRRQPLLPGPSQHWAAMVVPPMSVALGSKMHVSAGVSPPPPASALTGTHVVGAAVVGAEVVGAEVAAEKRVEAVQRSKGGGRLSRNHQPSGPPSRGIRIKQQHQPFMPIECLDADPKSLRVKSLRVKSLRVKSLRVKSLRVKSLRVKLLECQIAACVKSLRIKSLAYVTEFAACQIAACQTVAYTAEKKPIKSLSE